MQALIEAFLSKRSDYLKWTAVPSICHIGSHRMPEALVSDRMGAGVEGTF
jgi:hypothetical protein